MLYKNFTVANLVGKTLSSVDYDGDAVILFNTTDGDTYKMYHKQECCEAVSVDDICGDLQDIVGSVILVAEEVSNMETPKTNIIARDSETWTFYKIDTAKGGVTIRWYGSSNGYYSEGVDFCRM